MADIGFGGGVFALGLDLKNTANGIAGTAGFVPQPFTLNLFSGATSLFSLLVTTVPDGATFTFAGFISDTPITRLTITSQNVSPNLDVVLDNIAVSREVTAAVVPEPGTVTLAAGGLLALAAWGRTRARRRQTA